MIESFFWSSNFVHSVYCSKEGEILILREIFSQQNFFLSWPQFTNSLPYFFHLFLTFRVRSLNVQSLRIMRCEREEVRNLKESSYMEHKWLWLMNYEVAAGIILKYFLFEMYQNKFLFSLIKVVLISLLVTASYEENSLLIFYKIFI